jgi:hypothetical protein
MAKRRSSRSHMAAPGLPAWAPPSLVTSYRQLDEALSHGSDADEIEWDLTELDVLRRLLNDPRMQGVWAALHARRQMPDAVLADLVREVVASVFEYVHMPRRTRSEHRAHFEEVTNLTKQLRRKILRDLGQQSARAGAYYWARNLLSYLHAAKLTEAQSRIVRQGVHRWLEAERGPTFNDFLEDLELAATSMQDQKPLLAKPGSAAAKGSYVALRVVLFFEKKLHSPLHGHAATIASVVTGIDLDLDAVRRLRDRRA